MKFYSKRTPKFIYCQVFFFHRNIGLLIIVADTRANTAYDYFYFETDVSSDVLIIVIRLFLKRTPKFRIFQFL